MNFSPLLWPTPPSSRERRRQRQPDHSNRATSTLTATNVNMYKICGTRPHKRVTYRDTIHEVPILGTVLSVRYTHTQTLERHCGTRRHKRVTYRDTIHEVPILGDRPVGPLHIHTSPTKILRCTFTQACDSPRYDSLESYLGGPFCRSVMYTHNPRN